MTTSEQPPLELTEELVDSIISQYGLLRKLNLSNNGACTQSYIHTYIHTCMHAYIYTHEDIYIYIYICIVLLSSLFILVDSISKAVLITPTVHVYISHLVHVLIHIPRYMYMHS